MLDPDFVADCPYGPDALLFDEILTIDREASRLVARMPTHEALPLTRDQRTHPLRHPRHVSGGLIIHATGMLGFAHGYYILGLRHADGWIAYGTNIHAARFRKMGKIGEPMILSITATSLRRIRGTMVVRYQFRFEQGGDIVYEGDQSALWSQVEERAA
jgi:hypothetical protein